MEVELGRQIGYEGYVDFWSTYKDFSLLNGNAEFKALTVLPISEDSHSRLDYNTVIEKFMFNWNVLNMFALLC